MNKFKIGDKTTNKIFAGTFEIVEINSGASKNLYLCYQKGFDGHSGDTQSQKYIKTGKFYPTNEYLYASEDFLEKMQSQLPEVRITTDGKHTTATKFIDGEKIKEATVTLYYKDKFDFNVGAEEALKKLNSLPHLEWIDASQNRQNMGEIGKDTKHTALFGEELHVGDVVQVYDTMRNAIFESTFVCDDIDIAGSKPFIMGFKGCHVVNGIYQSLQLKKIKSFTELKNGEIIDDIKVVM